MVRVCTQNMSGRSPSASPRTANREDAVKGQSASRFRAHPKSGRPFFLGSTRLDVISHAKTPSARRKTQISWRLCGFARGFSRQTRKSLFLQIAYRCRRRRTMGDAWLVRAAILYQMHLNFPTRPGTLISLGTFSGQSPSSGGIGSAMGKYPAIVTAQPASLRALFAKQSPARIAMCTPESGDCFVADDAPRNDG